MSVKEPTHWLTYNDWLGSTALIVLSEDKLGLAQTIVKHFIKCFNLI